jgi:hypothetical protein
VERDDRGNNYAAGARCPVGKNDHHGGENDVSAHSSARKRFGTIENRSKLEKMEEEPM